jgi:hypothetical protein
VRIFVLTQTISDPPTQGHPEPAPHLVNEQPQVGGKRSGLLSAFPRTEPKQTFLRGAWATDRNGVAQFTCASLTSPRLPFGFTCS